MCLSLARCAEPASDPRDATLRSVFARADQSLLRSRPSLVAGRYARMARGAYDFDRGSLPLFLHDGATAPTSSRARASPSTSRSPGARATPSNPLENFGTSRARHAARPRAQRPRRRRPRAPPVGPPSTHGGLRLAARLSNPDAPEARAAVERAIPAIVRAAATAYADAIAAHARGAARARVTAGGGDLVLDDLFLVAGSATPTVAASCPTSRCSSARAARFSVGRPTRPIPRTFSPSSRSPRATRSRRCRPATARPARTTARGSISAVRQRPRVRQRRRLVAPVRALVLARGPSDAPDDDVILEVKELADSVVPGGRRRACGSTPCPRGWGRASARALWAVPDADPLWGADEWLGLPVLVRTESAGHKTIRVDRLVAALGTPDALTSLARHLGALVARLHAAPLPDGTSVAPAIASVVARDPAGFAQEQADVSDRYAVQLLADWERFRRALTDRGPSLGLPLDATDAPTPDQRALFGTPPARSF